MQADRRLRCAALVVVSLLIATAYGWAQAQTVPSGPATIEQVEVGGENGTVTVRVRGEGVLTVHEERLTGPDRLVLDFANARLGAVHAAAAGPVGPVRGIRAGQFKPDVARVVVDLETATAYRVETGVGSITVVFGADGSTVSQAPPMLKQLRTEVVHNAAATTVPAVARVTRESSVPANPKLPEVSGGSSSATAFARVAPAAATAVPASATPAAGSPAPMEAASNLPNSFQNGLLTFRAKDRPLDLVLDDIGSLTNIPIVLADGVQAEHVSAEFRGYRLDEALRQILKNYDVLFSYGSSNDSEGNPTPRTVWVYPPDHGPGMGRFAMEAWKSSTRQYQQIATAADPDKRARAVDELIRRDGRGAVSVVMDALKDPSDKVRYQALYRAVLVGALPPEDTMIDLALNDTSEQVRVWAFQTLPLDPTLQWVALRVSNDSNQQMAELARNYLKDLDASTGTAAPRSAPPTPEAPQAAPDATPPSAAPPQPLVRHPVTQAGP